ncbi:MAG TPA: hypothetical protein VFV52_03950 [Bacilli bacterium]|nr:hypothetical protein [Bacilli bacterium]
MIEEAQKFHPRRILLAFATNDTLDNPHYYFQEAILVDSDRAITVEVQHDTEYYFDLYEVERCSSTYYFAHVFKVSWSWRGVYVHDHDEFVADLGTKTLPELIEKYVRRENQLPKDSQLRNGMLGSVRRSVPVGMTKGSTPNS